MVYGVIGGFFAYLLMNWQYLYLIRGQLLCIFSMMAFFTMLFSIGNIYGFANFCGGFLGGFLCSLGILKPLRERNLVLVIGGLVGLALYWLMMFLIFYLAVWLLKINCLIFLTNFIFLIKSPTSTSYDQVKKNTIKQFRISVNEDFINYNSLSYWKLLYKWKRSDWKKPISKNGVVGNWTPGLLNANQALYQLSYNPS